MLFLCLGGMKSAYWRIYFMRNIQENILLVFTESALEK